MDTTYLFIVGFSLMLLSSLISLIAIWQGIKEIHGALTDIRSWLLRRDNLYQCKFCDEVHEGHSSLNQDVKEALCDCGMFGPHRASIHETNNIPLKVENLLNSSNINAEENEATKGMW